MAGPWLHRCAVVLGAVSLVSVFTGTAVTSNEERPYYALGQSHWWLGLAAGVLTIALTLGLGAARERVWLRRLSWSALGAVVFQAVLGLQPLPQAPAVRVAHAMMAQLFFSAAAVMAVSTGRRWREPAKRVQGTGWLWGMAHGAPVAVLAQVALGTLFRHGAMGVGPHLIGAFGIAFFILGVTMAVIYRPEHGALHAAARALLTVAGVQVFVGMALFSMQSMDLDPGVVILTTMIHGATGAMTLAATVVMAVLVRRHVYLAG